MAFGRYDELSEIQGKLLEQNRIDIYGEIEGPMVRYVRDALIRLTIRGSPDIEIFITSPGGNVDAGLDICDLLSTYKGKKRGYVLDRAASMAAIILQVCDTRVVAHHGTIMIHHVSRSSVSLDQLRDEAKLKKLRDDLEKSQARLYHILTSRTGKDLETIKKVCEEERHMSGEEAKTFGLIDEIATIQLPPPTNPQTPTAGETH